jgi:hypothetical protein
MEYPEASPGLIGDGQTRGSPEFTKLPLRPGQQAFALIEGNSLEKTRDYSAADRRIGDRCLGATGEGQREHQDD